MGRFSQVFFQRRIRMSYSGRVPTDDVEFSAGRHSGCHCTSVGPAYIIGDGKMARTVLSGSRTFSSSMVWCCSIRTGSGTSSSLVQPPRGWSSRTGLLKPRSSRACRVYCIKRACPLWTGFLSWKAKTASAPKLKNFRCSSVGVSRY